MYIAWFVCLSTAAAAGFFTLLYGLQFDNKQQEQWLVSMFISMFQDILISQPLKVIIVATFFALLFKKPQDEEDDLINAELARDEEWLEKNLTLSQKGGKTAVTQSLRPPDKVFSVLVTYITVFLGCHTTLLFRNLCLRTPITTVIAW